MASPYISAGLSKSLWNNMKAPDNCLDIIQIGTFSFDAKQSNMKEGSLSGASILPCKLIL